MRLINVPLSDAPKPYAVFEELKGEKFDNFETVT
jgi:hypothetical protein